MRPRPVATVLLALTVLAFAAAADDPGAVEGSFVKYGRAGVELRGRAVPWAVLKTLADLDPDFATLRAEARERSEKAGDSAGGHAALGLWCRENGLEDLAKQELQRTIELDPNHESARKALGFLKVADEWKPARETYEERRKGLDPKKKQPTLDLIAFCRDHALVEEEWGLLIELLSADRTDKAAIKLLRPLVERRLPKTSLRPPFAGRWLGMIDDSHHHQNECFSITAIDFTRVDEKGESHTGAGTALTDYYAYDQPVYAAADGEVVSVKDGFKDMPPGKRGKFDEGNLVVIQHGPEESTTYIHLKPGSAAVKVGDKVNRGQEIGRVGNSGATHMPHLHFALLIRGVDSAKKFVSIGVPYRFEKFRLVEAFGVPCTVQVEIAHPQEGWVIECDKPE